MLLDGTVAGLANYHLWALQLREIRALPDGARSPDRVGRLSTGGVPRRACALYELLGERIQLGDDPLGGPQICPGTRSCAMGPSSGERVK